jgi:hypothetical protein
MENDKAMLEYVSLIDRLDVGANKDTLPPPDRPNAVRRTSLKPGQVLMKQGILYKQRDVFKGWRPRNFVLIDNTLTYYVEGEEGTPKGTLALSGCSCAAGTPSRAEGVEYFHFTITHPGNNKPYHLSALSKTEADDWIAKINQAGKTQDPQISSKTTHTRRSTYTTNGAEGGSMKEAADTAMALEGVQSPASSTVPFSDSGANSATDRAAEETESAATNAPSTNDTAIVKPDATLKNVPAHLADKLESKIADMFDAISPGAPGWEIFMDKEGVKGLKRPGQGDLSAIRADSLFPYNILDVFQCVTSVECLMIMDTMRKQQDKLKILSNHSWIEYFRFRDVSALLVYGYGLPVVFIRCECPSARDTRIFAPSDIVFRMLTSRLPACCLLTTVWLP